MIDLYARFAHVMMPDEFRSFEAQFFDPTKDPEAWDILTGKLTHPPRNVGGYQVAARLTQDELDQAWQDYQRDRMAKFKGALLEETARRTVRVFEQHLAHKEYMAREEARIKAEEEAIVYH